MKPNSGVLLLMLAAVALPALAQHGHQPMHSHFDDADKWSKVFDDPKRDAWQKPVEVVRALSLAPDSTVADIGSGTGYFSVRLARALPQGRVYGADLAPDMVKHLNERARRENLPNLSSHAAAADDPKLPAQVDLVLIVDTYHHIGARERYFGKLRASLKPGGRIAVIDFRPDSPVGPPREFRIAPGRVKAEMEHAGYRISTEHTFLPNQYFLVFAPTGG
ncbi:MAG: class I SAM-dependent methyltransferase [Betaproteobacteria bacterium]|nr:class I SAM-dependent methyltransferase [Betaproteobacteria bacterium]